ncbi:hypothetical protein WJX81_001860 [Elliptochloris bilobata]|uniref:CBS domain-containing protein n=1 Tax=Elliptochloris bilobata TaxID=381761 RepID=A0AAW1RCB9_9CHLO
MPTHSSSVRDLLVSTKLKAVLQDHKAVVVLKDSATVEQALAVLAGNRILSAPVVAPSAGSSAGARSFEANAAFQDIVCCLDLRDVLCSFLEELDVPAVKDMKMLRRMKELEEKGGQFAVRAIKTLPILGKRSLRSCSDGAFYLESGVESMSVLELVHDGLLYPREARKAIAGGSRTRTVVHRIALYDRQIRITHIISQSDIARFLLEHRERLGDLGDATVESLGWAAQAVITVTPETPAVVALALMAEKGISGLGVVNARGLLIANFSISDLRTIVAEHFGAMALPVGEFLALEHGTEFWGVDRAELQTKPASMFASNRELRRRESAGCQVGQALVLATAQETFSEVLEKLVANRLHRLYVVDTELRPVGIVTLTDILRTVTQQSVG